MPQNIPFTPQLLGQRLEGLNILFLGTCQAGPLVDAAPGLGYKINHMLFESFRHSAIPDIDMRSMDAVVVGLTIRHVIYDAIGAPLGRSDMFQARMQDEIDIANLLDCCSVLLNEKLVSLHAALKGVPTFFLSFLEPGFNYLGNLVSRYDPSSAKYFLQKLNEKLYYLIRGFSNFHFIDINEVINFVGRMHIHDDEVYSATHASFVGDFLIGWDSSRLIPPSPIYPVEEIESRKLAFGQVFWNVLADNLKILRQVNPVKLIIVDLDDTLWRGIAAEESVPNWTRIEGWPMGFVESLLYFKNRGGLLAICSKNDHEPTIKQLADIWHDAITVDDFASIKINWSPKSTNIAEILRETNLLPHNVVFIDDNPREIDEVKAHFPEIRCLGGNHYDWRRIILRSPETQVPYVTEESLQRTKLIRALVQREVLAQSMSRQEWLVSLNIQQSFFLLRNDEPKLFERAFELINKTNQFNTTGKRWQHSEMQQFFTEGGVCLLTSLKDKTVDNGIIGATLIKGGEIVQAVLSCRVFGLGAEIAMGSIATRIALKQSSTVTGRIIDTGKNFACHKYYESLGFENRDDHFGASQACVTPDWIALVNLDPEDFSLLDHEKGQAE